MTERLLLALPAKGRLMDKAFALFDRAGLSIKRDGHERVYQGRVEGLDEVEVMFLSASEIVYYIKSGRVHLGVTGEDLVHEHLAHAGTHADLLLPLGFGHADVVVAVPDCWIDVHRMADLEEVARTFRRVHGRRMKVATKYMTLTRRFFAEKGVTSYRLAESLGATEGAPAAEMAELIADITSTGATLKANHLRVLDDGLIMQSQANLIASKAAEWTQAASQACNEIVEKLEKALAPKEEDA